MKLISLLLLALITAAGRNAYGAVYYVDGANPACSDAGPGSITTPCCTIGAAVVAHGAPGNTILVRPATYREQITVPVSGAVGAPLILRADGGSPIVDGAENLSSSASWTPVSGDVWLAAAVTWAPKQVRVDSTRLDTTSVDPTALPARTFRYLAGAGLYVNAGGGNPGARQIFVGRRVNGFRLTARSWVTIEGFTILRSDDKGIQLTGPCSDVTIARNDVSLCAKQGISVGWASAVAITANRTHDNGDHGIHCLTGVTGSTLAENESFRNARPRTRAANGINLFASSGNRIERNRLHDNQDSGLDLSGASNDNVMIQNRSWKNGDHGFDDLNSSGGSHVGDVAWGNFKDGFSVEGSSTNTRLSDCIATDNGLGSDEFDLFVDLGAVAGFSSDDNLFWNSTAQAPVRFNGIRFATVSAFMAATGHDIRTLQADPRFSNPAAGDFRLGQGSPAIDSGNSGVPNWPAADADGRARNDDPATPNRGLGPIAFADRGALEFDAAPVLGAPAQVAIPENQTVSFPVTALDPDGDGITSLTADLSRLPSGHGASFAVNAAMTAGTLSWRPTFADAGSYVVVFRAANTRSDAESTSIVVSNTNRAPVVTAPATVTVPTRTPVHITVTAADPDGEPITSLTADLSQLEGATFTVNATRTSGVLSWNSGRRNNRNYDVTFTARNAQTTVARTQIRVRNNGALATAGTEGVPASGADTSSAAIESAAAPPSSDRLTLSRVFPNPSEGEMAAVLDLPRGGRVDWTIHDLQGRTLHAASREFGAGRWSLMWNGEDDRGARPPAGVYLLRVSTAGQRLTRRFVLLPR